MSPASPGIGSVFAREEPSPASGESLWAAWTKGRSWAAYQTARGALGALLRARGIGRVWLPAYACEALAAGVAAGGAEIGWYGVGARLEPDPTVLEAALRPGDAVVGIDYFGRSPGQAFRDLAASRRDVLWIEDRAQALAPDAFSWGDSLLYSPRKLLGVSDGGLLVGVADVPSPAPIDGDVLDAPERARAADLDGRQPERWFPLFQLRESGLTTEPVGMSRRTQAVLEATPWAAMAQARQANYAALLERLAPLALWPDAPPAFAPLAFPVVVRDRDRLAAGLAERRIWCARQWPTLPSPRERFPAEHDLAGRILSLPCDQRYGPEAMARVADAVLALASAPVGREEAGRLAAG